MNKQQLKKELTAEQRMNRRNFISFSTFIAMGAAGFAGWKWLSKSGIETPGFSEATAGAQKPLRRALNKTELFFRKTFSNNHLVKTYPVSKAATQVRVNSHIGMNDPAFPADNWQLVVKRSNGNNLSLSIADLKSLPKTEIIFDFKCVEGWDQIQYWGGLRFVDFVAHYKLEDEVKKGYVGMETPNGKYYVGLDMESAMHSQTILAYEMNGKSLLPQHGAPLRLIIPVKYGIKNLKQIGSINFSDRRPRDYWAEFGYDYYSGL